MAEGIQLRITHARRLLPTPPYSTSTRRTSSILIDDIKSDEARRGLRLPAQYVPYAMPGGAPGYIDLVFTSLVAQSFETGDIRGLITDGEVTVEFLVGSLIKQGLATTRVEALITPYDVDANTDVVLVNPAVAGAFTVNLPEGSTHISGIITVKDKKNMALATPITINAFAGDTIDGAASTTISSNRGAWTFVFSGTEWSIV